MIGKNERILAVWLDDGEIALIDFMRAMSEVGRSLLSRSASEVQSKNRKIIARGGGKKQSTSLSNSQQRRSHAQTGESAASV